MGIREERSRGRTRLAFLTSGEREPVPATPAAPEWLAEPGGTGFDGDTTWSAERRRGVFSLPDRWRDARFDPGRSGAVALIVVGIVVAVATVVGVRSDRPETQSVPSLPAASGQSTAAAADSTTPSAGAAPAAAPAEEIVVSVVGLVTAAGLVRLPPGSRVADALAAAGGVRDGADTLGLNLAQRLSDGDQVLVGAATTQAPPSAVGGTSTGSPSAGGAIAAAGGLVNLNTATATELDALPGVGPVTAAAIVAWRTTNGTFTDISQLGEVDGIGPVRLEKLRGQVTL
ncbi:MULTISPECIES: ComEA family DNA-binding protein [unclassified Rhodococcus (in: high G+C Gram-positive bacteria)]|uniref:ComEA family DNA-binding protein n=1 Tax=unclassified Rhodococcus (in: high G+C Gram-positive bacteria) TaxID=192944 RepID=UPI00163ACA2F|nr:MULTISPECIES: ComEA family DNA-binding protein [unclassified Rhodococcus (in: high G+C Gram-positive bacteria)]MBC2638741.1 ComEA family DNA-binding protein [Rhodococcus sp. 3A]MBC2896518.1 ComEA family DNA-binding protein [Rhodococcus sp. 4CII]